MSLIVRLKMLVIQSWRWMGGHSTRSQLSLVLLVLLLMLLLLLPLVALCCFVNDTKLILLWLTEQVPIPRKTRNITSVCIRRLQQRTEWRIGWMEVLPLIGRMTRVNRTKTNLASWSELTWTGNFRTAIVTVIGTTSAKLHLVFSIPFHSIKI